MHKSCRNLNTQHLTNLFSLYCPFLPHMYTHTSGTPETDNNALASLVVGQEGGELCSNMHLIFSDFYYIQNSTSMRETAGGSYVCQCVCVEQCVWYTSVPPIPTSITNPLPVHLAGLMVSHRTLYSAVTHTLTHKAEQSHTLETADTLSTHLMEAMV